MTLSENLSEDESRVHVCVRAVKTSSFLQALDSISGSALGLLG